MSLEKAFSVLADVGCGDAMTASCDKTGAVAYSVFVEDSTASLPMVEVSAERAAAEADSLRRVLDASAMAFWDDALISEASPSNFEGSLGLAVADSESSKGGASVPG
jgi:hypothetical protein